MEKPDIRQFVGDKIRELRKKYGWTQEELAMETGLHRNYIGGIERGERNLALLNIEKLAQALDVRPRDLLP